MKRALNTNHDFENPLPCVEDVLEDKNWVSTRTAEDELLVEITGQAGEYRLFFIWDKAMHSLHLCVRYNLHIHADHHAEAITLINTINENLWLGYFCLSSTSPKPTFRHTQLLGHDHNSITEQIGTLVDMALHQCEQNHPGFAMLTQPEGMDDKTLPLAFMTPLGQS